MRTDIERIPQTTYGSLMLSNGRMIAAPMVVLAAPYVDMRCTRRGPYRYNHVRGMNPLGKRSCPTFTGKAR